MNEKITYSSKNYKKVTKRMYNIQRIVLPSILINKADDLVFINKKLKEEFDNLTDHHEDFDNLPEKALNFNNLIENTWKEICENASQFSTNVSKNSVIVYRDSYESSFKKVKVESIISSPNYISSDFSYLFKVFEQKYSLDGDDKGFAHQSKTINIDSSNTILCCLHEKEYLEYEDILNDIVTRINFIILDIDFDNLNKEEVEIENLPVNTEDAIPSKISNIVDNIEKEINQGIPNSGFNNNKDNIVNSFIKENEINNSNLIKTVEGSANWMKKNLNESLYVDSNKSLEYKRQAIQSLLYFFTTCEMNRENLRHIRNLSYIGLSLNS
jgi:hypothetical protein